MSDRIYEMSEIANNISSADNIALFPHVGVDGDCLGSTIALAEALEIAGCNVRIFSEGPIPDRFDFMPGINRITIYNGFDTYESIIENYFGGRDIDMSMLVDCAMPPRIGSCENLFEKGIVKAVIDHHFTVKCTQDLCCIDPSACASGELIYDFIGILEKKFGKKLMNQKAAENIYIAIFSDTGGFSYSNTTARTFEIACRLFEKYSIDTRKAAYNLYERTTKAKIKLEGMAFRETTFHYDDKVAVCLISRKMIEECNAVDNDVDGICAQLKNIEGVVVSFVLREKENNEIRGNIRSQEGFDASEFAVSQGGGGHMRAAGFNLSGMTLHEAFDKIVRESKDYLKV